MELRQQKDTLPFRVIPTLRPAPPLPHRDFFSPVCPFKTICEALSEADPVVGN